MAISRDTVVVSPISPSAAFYGTSLNALALGPQCYERLRTYLVNTEDVGFGAGIFPVLCLESPPAIQGHSVDILPIQILYSGGCT